MALFDVEPIHVVYANINFSINNSLDKQKLVSMTQILEKKLSIFAIIRKPLLDFIPHNITDQQKRYFIKMVRKFIRPYSLQIGYFFVVPKILFMFTNIYKYLQGFPSADSLCITWCNGNNRYNSCCWHLCSIDIVDIPKMDSTGIFVHGNRSLKIFLCSMIEIQLSCYKYNK